MVINIGEAVFKERERFVDLGADVDRLTGDDNGVLFLGNLGVGVDVALTKKELSGLSTTLCLESDIYHCNGLR